MQVHDFSDEKVLIHRKWRALTTTTILVYILCRCKPTTRFSDFQKQNKSKKSAAKKTAIKAGPFNFPISDIQSAQSLQKCCFQAVSGTCLWTSNWISTAWDVQKPHFCKTTLICPIIFLPSYRIFTGTFSNTKRLILWVKDDLSTKKSTFTTTTRIYIYKLT